MKKNIMLILCIIMFSLTINTYAADTIYSLNKYSEEKFENIIKSYDEDNKQDGFITAGRVLKEKNRIIKIRFFWWAIGGSNPGPSD